MSEEEIITPEEAGVVAEEEVVATNVDTTVEEEVAPETVSDENVDVATEVVETVEEVA